MYGGWNNGLGKEGMAAQKTGRPVLHRFVLSCTPHAIGCDVFATKKSAHKHMCIVERLWWREQSVSAFGIRNLLSRGHQRDGYRRHIILYSSTFTILFEVVAPDMMVDAFVMANDSKCTVVCEITSFEHCAIIGERSTMIYSVDALVFS